MWRRRSAPRPSSSSLLAATPPVRTQRLNFNFASMASTWPSESPRGFRDRVHATQVTVHDQQSWKIPPCVSNWKNARGYTIPLDKRLAADGRGLQEQTVNNNFATLVRSPRFEVLRRLHFIQTTRGHLTMTWVVYFSILRPFATRRSHAGRSTVHRRKIGSR